MVTYLVYTILTFTTFVIVTKNIIGIENSKKNYMLYFVIFLLMSVSSKSYEQLGGLTMIVGMGIILYTDHYSILESAIIPLFSMITILVVSFFYELIFEEILGIISLRGIINEPVKYLFAFIPIMILAYVVSKIIGKYAIKRNQQLISGEDAMLQGSIALLFFFIFIALYTFIFQSSEGTKAYVLFIYSITIAICIVVVHLLYKSMRKEDILHRNKLELEHLKAYTENLEIIYNDMRKVRHDYMNVMSSMIGYIENEDIAGLKTFFNTNILDYTKQMKDLDFALARLSFLSDNELKGLVAIKVIQAQEAGIKTDIDIVETIDFSHCKAIDLCRVLGILLDNAIEGTKNVERPKLEIGFIRRENAKMIVIQNTCDADSFALNCIYQKGYSTKGDNRGIGLSNLKEILRQYDQCDIETMVTEGVFRQVLHFSE